MDFVRKHFKEVVLGGLILANIFVWLAIWQRRPSNILSVYFLNVGQGDAILIESPTRKRVLIDGGPNRQVLSELGKVLPFGSKNIDVVIETHPDRDHIGGLPEVVSRLEVGLFIEPGVESENSIDDELEARLSAKGVNGLVAKRGMILDLGKGAKLYIIFPNTDVSQWETNDASIVAKLVYGNTSFLLTGDAGLKTENILLSLGSDILDSDVLKVGHHGSRTSTSLAFVNSTTPEYAIISAGKDNSYGHPHKEVLDNLNKFDTQILNTAEKGTIVFKTDGEKLLLRD